MNRVNVEPATDSPAANTMANAVVPAPNGGGLPTSIAQDLKWRVVAVSGSVTAGTGECRIKAGATVLWRGRANAGKDWTPDLGPGIPGIPGQTVSLEVDAVGVGNFSTASISAVIDQ